MKGSRRAAFSFWPAAPEIPKGFWGILEGVEKPAKPSFSKIQR
jgi:hypothetical protein